MKKAHRVRVSGRKSLVGSCLPANIFYFFGTFSTSIYATLLVERGTITILIVKVVIWKAESLDDMDVKK